MIFIPDDELDEFIGSCCRRLRQNNAEELYAAIGYGGITIANCLPKLKEEWQKRKSEEDKNEQLAKVDLSKVHATDGVVVEGFDNTPIKFAKCCSPLPGDPIVGFITRGFGVSIHKQSCVNAIASMKDRHEGFHRNAGGLPSGRCGYGIRRAEPEFLHHR